MPRIKEFRPPTSVWSSYGHRFMSDGDGADEWGYWHESCLTCGAVYQLKASSNGRGEYMASDGSEPMECSRDTGMAHGYLGERVIAMSHQHPRNYSEHGCPHVDHDCNCLLCGS